MMLSVAIRHAFADFTLDARFEAPAGVTALFGQSGSGKTSIVNAVAGLMRPDHARIEAGGTVLTDTAARRFLPPHRRGIGYVFQEARLFPHLSVRQNLLYGRRFSHGGGAVQDRVVEMLGIGHLLQRRPAALSGGERQRVALGRAILSNPRLLLMDEPLAALDQARKDGILPYLERLRDETGLPILYVSHSAAEVARLANTIVLLRAGRVAASGPAAQILSDPATAPLLGPREVGAILSARIEAQEADGLTRLASAAGPLWLSRIDSATGAVLRLRILAQDVMIALDRPTGISALNVLAGVVRDLTPDDGAMLVRLEAGSQTLLARITTRSAQALALHPGKPVHAVLKAVSVAPGSIGSGSDPSISRHAPPARDSRSV
ncbi:MAG: molybdenum ABC transporter ATP-binding protein [Paracoccus sp. (in: a-proteobacteria)]|uniref:molybdenum ABC transporter ATP-binding protein n=2 Tax=Paracoccus TaxID=265 RepID=UPI0025D7E3E1|nr:MULTISPECIES: molybdenum ABC transporter ATP-binding protein [unclassified Paracoccus (in: a-proteobacteria)]|tara:strand:- start:12269 stop:13402 length:1134 start_codon:yes stop_codon:yes gene_type:complete